MEPKCDTTMMLHEFGDPTNGCMSICMFICTFDHALLVLEVSFKILSLFQLVFVYSYYFENFVFFVMKFKLYDLIPQSLDMFMWDLVWGEWIVLWIVTIHLKKLP